MVYFEIQYSNDSFSTFHYYSQRESLSKVHCELNFTSRTNVDQIMSDKNIFLSVLTFKESDKIWFVV